jgi:NB-ARC domain
MGPEIPTRNFLGRKSIIEEIHSALKVSVADRERHLKHNSGPRSFGLCGLGGVGKSQIAVEYIHSHQNDYEAIFWVQADSPNSIAESFGQIASEMGLLNPSEKIEIVVSRNVVMEWLSNPVKQSATNLEDEASVLPALATWLIVFDNADDLEVLRDYWPTTGNGAVLITSRDPLAKSYATNNAGRDLDPLSAEEASSLLTSLAGYSTTPTTAGHSLDLAKRLGGLPLAITQIAAMIRGRDLTFLEFLDIYDEECSKKELLLNQDKYSHTLSTIWRLEKHDSAAQSLLNLLSLLDPDYIRESLFTNYLPAQSKSGFPATNLAYYEARKGLVQSSVVRRNKEQGRLLIHRLVQDVNRAHMTITQLRDTFELIVDIIYKSWPEASFKFSHATSIWDEADELVPHVLRITEIYTKNTSWELPATILRRLAELLQKCGWSVDSSPTTRHKLPNTNQACCRER